LYKEIKELYQKTQEHQQEALTKENKAIITEDKSRKNKYQKLLTEFTTNKNRKKTVN
jgi:hypothetical protein